MMKVKAALGLKVPKEDNPRRYITDEVAQEVPKTTYYLRRVSFGELLEVSDEVEPPKVEQPKKRGKK